MADWEEIKKLAADFQRTQTNDNLQRLSERNCIDIVKKLADLNLIELIYTRDGKEYLTPTHLTREIEDEVYVNGGRMHLHELADKLNVDYQHVENRSNELIRDKPEEYYLILGQLIHSTYKNTLGKQINNSMLMTGQLSIAEFSKTLDLPSEFLLTMVKEILPKVMDDYVASQDERTYYTADMMDRYKSIIAGTLSAILKPTTIASLMKRLDIPERIFLPTVEGLIKSGRLDASVENRLFIPSVYAREQNEWIDKFYRSNSYIEYDVLSRMDITQPKAFLKKRFPDGVALKTCFISTDLLSQVESLIEDSIASNGFIDIETIVPSVIESDDIDHMLQEIFKKKFSCLVFDRTYVCSHGYIQTCKSIFDDMMQSRAQEDLNQGKLINYFLGGKEQPKNNEPIKAKSDEVDDDPLEEKSMEQIIEEETNSKMHRRKGKDKKAKAELEDSDDDQVGKKSKGRKSGGGLVGREVKQKAVKKKYLPGNKGPKFRSSKEAARSSSPIRKAPLIFMNMEELVGKLKIKTRDSGDCSDEFHESIAKLIESDLNHSYETLAKQTLDEYLKAQEENKEEEIDLVEPLLQAE